ncbi:MAG: hypothetical protein CBB65_05420 [Hyphomonadaceae bacterium TMED5]|nr:N-formylglutamate amidohydrolase [Ponticaulis sp.]OUX99535.1 MAG: hypothetical protein CBB65_05420 [Hyphomonadaceae bacterium TMED5]|tara:strand:- start:92110 stop:92994 length:885 start_codon:yes stop_codon:yes gene_type:complete
MTTEHTIIQENSAEIQRKPAFVLTPPDETCSVFFASPHSGRYYPQDFQDLLCVPIMDLRRVEDAYVDQLISPISKLGAGLISAVYARSYVDLNRSQDELDSRMFCDGPPNPAGERSPRVEAGLGCIPRIAASGQDIHQRKLTRQEAEDRLDVAYRPYHSALANWLNILHGRFGKSVLIDCHSMPSLLAGRRIQADIIIGNRHGSACDESLARLVENAFAALGYRVLRNTPYAGGYVTQMHGRPMEDRQALQIEINRRLYMDEREVRLKTGFYKLQSDLKSVAGAIMNWAERRRS